MTEPERFIICHLQNDSIEPPLIFLNASMNTLVFQLKALIQEKRKNGVLQTVDSDALVLWKLKDPVAVKPLDTLRQRLNVKELLLSADKLPILNTVSEIFPEPISSVEIHIIVTLLDGYPFVPWLTAKLRADRVEYSERRPNIDPSSLGTPKAFHSAQTRSQGPAFVFDRPPTAAGTIPVTLLHPIFAQFKDDCATHNPVVADTKLALEITSEMAEFYDSEGDRIAAFRHILTDNCLTMHAGLVDGTKYWTHGDMRLDSLCYCLVAGKNEFAGHDADPIFQAGAHYVELMTKASTEHPHARLPALLMYVVGAQIGFVGAVYTTKPNLQILVNPLVLSPHHTDKDIRTAAARYFGALRKAVHSLQEYYKSFPSTIDSSDKPEFPYWRKYTSLLDGTARSFVYKAQLYEKLIFLGKEDDGHEICVKFVHNYSEAAHSACAKMGFAPALKGFEKLPGNWYMVVMEKIDSSFHHFNESHSTPALYKDLKQKLTDLHQAGFVHGDIRDVNLLVRGGDDEHPMRFMLVDFDWAGLIGIATYPLYINRANIWRPDGAQDGNLILTDHDISMLDKIFGRMSLR